MRGFFRRSTLAVCAALSIACLVVPLAFAHPGFAQTSGVGLLKVADYPLAERLAPRTDLSFDATLSRLYIADSAEGVVRVLDTETHAFLASVPLPGVNRVLAVPDAGAVYAATSADTALRAIDSKVLSIVGTIEVGADIGDLAYAPSTGSLYVSSKRAPTATFIDTRTNEVVAQIDLGAVGVSPVYDSNSGTIRLVLPAQNQLATLGADGLVSVADFPACASPRALAIDDERHLAFMTCQANAQLAVVDLDTLQLLGRQDLGKAPAAVVFESQLHMVYVAAEGGVIFVFREDPLDRGGLQLVTNPIIGPHVRSLGLDTGTRHVYVPTLNIRGTPVLRELVILSLPEPE